MLHKIPLGLAGVVAYGMYVALGNDSCQMANRAAMPIHWVGSSLNYLTNNLHASNNEAKGDSVLKGFDSAAAYVRDGILVLGQGKAFCTTFQASLIEPVPVQEPIRAPSQTPATAPPSTAPVFAPIGQSVPVFVNPTPQGTK